MGVGEDLLGAERGHSRHAGVLKQVHQVIVGIAHGPLGHVLIQLGAVLPAAEHTVVLLVLSPGRIAHGALQGLPLLVAAHGNADPLVVALAAVDIVGRHNGILVAAAVGGGPIHGILHQLRADEGTDAFRGAQVNILALAGLLPVQKGGQGGIGGEGTYP